MSITHFDEPGTDLNGVAWVDEDLEHEAIALGQNRVLHLHGFDQKQALARAHPFIRSNQDADDLTGQGCDRQAVPGARPRSRLRHLELGAIADAELETLISVAQLDLFRKVLEPEDPAIDFGGPRHDSTASLFDTGFGRDVHAKLAVRVRRFDRDTEVSAAGSHEILLEHVSNYRMNA